jgi:hypothetical protein
MPVGLPNEQSMRRLVELIMKCAEGALYAAQGFSDKVHAGKFTELSGMRDRLQGLAENINLQLTQAADVWQGEMPDTDRLKNMFHNISNAVAGELRQLEPGGMKARFDAALKDDGSFLRHFSDENAESLDERVFKCFEKLFSAWLVESGLKSEDGKITWADGKPIGKEMFFDLLNNIKSGFSALISARVGKDYSSETHAHEYPGGAPAKEKTTTARTEAQAAQDAAALERASKILTTDTIDTPEEVKQAAQEAEASQSAGAGSTTGGGGTSS